jgi:hypothetical protein
MILEVFIRANISWLIALNIYNRLKISLRSSQLNTCLLYGRNKNIHIGKVMIIEEEKRSLLPFVLKHIKRTLNFIKPRRT